MIANRERPEKPAATSATSGFIQKLMLDALMVLRLLVAAILRFLEPIIGFTLCALAIILAIVSIILKLSGDVPKFPFWGALGLSVGLYILSVVYALVVRLIAPKAND